MLLSYGVVLIVHGTMMSHRVCQKVSLRLGVESNDAETDSGRPSRGAGCKAVSE